MRKWKLLGAAYIVVFVGLIILAFHGDVFGTTYDLNPSFTISANDNPDCAHIDSLSICFALGGDSVWTRRAGTDTTGPCLYIIDTSVTTAGRWTVAWYAFDADTIKGFACDDYDVLNPVDVWSSGTRTLTALDEDETTIDLNNTQVGSVLGGVGSVTNAVTVGAVNAGAIESGDIATNALNFGGEIDTTGLGASSWGNETRSLTGTPNVNAIQISGSTAAADSLERQLLTGRILADIKAIDGDTADAEWLSIAAAAPGYMIGGTRYWFNGTGMQSVTATNNIPDVNVYTVTAGAIEDGDIATGGIDFGGELDTAGLGASVWGHETKNLTNLDADSIRDILGDSINVVDGYILADAAKIVSSADAAARLADFAIDGYDSTGDTVHTNIALAGSLVIDDDDMGRIADSVWQKNRDDVTKNDGMYGKLLDTTVSSRATTGVGISNAEMAAIADTLLNRKSHQHTDTTTVGGRIHALGDSLISQEWATAGATDVSDADMAAIADTVLGRKSHQQTDTTTVGGRIHAVGDSLISQQWATSGMAAITDADMVAIADTILGRKHHQNVDTTTVGGVIHALGDSLSTQIWGATGSSYGSGLQVDSIFVYDTSGTDAPVPDVQVTIQNNGQTANVAYGIATNSSGYVAYNLDASTDYKGIARLSGYIFPTKSFTSESGATSNDTIKGYNVEIGAPASASLKRVYDYVYSGDADTNVCKGTTFTATLVMPYGSGSSQYPPYDSTTGVLIPLDPRPTTADGDCYFYFDLYPNASTGGSSCIKPDGTRWQIIGRRGGRVVYNMIVKLTGTSAEQISTIYRGQTD